MRTTGTAGPIGFGALVVGCTLAIGWTMVAAVERMIIDFNEEAGPVSHIASGIFGGCYDSVPDSLFYPIKPSAARWTPGHGPPQDLLWDRLDSLGAVAVISIPKNCEIHGTSCTDYGGDNPLNKPCGDCWVRSDHPCMRVEQMVEIVSDVRRRLPHLKIHIDVWNEPDNCKYWTGSPESYFLLWKDVVKRLRERMPNSGEPDRTLISGPGWAGGLMGRGSGFTMPAFLYFCFQNDCLPDVLEWHSVGRPPSGRNVLQQVRFAAEELDTYGVTRFAMNEFMGREDYLEPGRIVRWFALAERSRPLGLKFACRSVSRSDDEGRLAGLVVERNGRFFKRFAWWTYKAYADMEGELVRVEPARSYDAVAARDTRASTATILVGRHRASGDGDLTLVLNGLDWISPTGVVRIEASQLFGGETALVAEEWVIPEPVLSRRDLISDGSLRLSLSDLNPSDAITITITPDH